MNRTPKAIRLTDRDLRLLAWINAVGFVCIDHIATWMKVAKSTAYVRMKKMVDQEYLTHERIFCGIPGVYRVTRRGVQVSGSELPPLRKVVVGSYHHDISVTELSLKLSKKYQARYIPERELRHLDGLEAFGKAGHTPDSVLVLGDKKIAIELELNKKGRKRRDKIMSHYMKAFAYDEVWYFCSTSEVKNQINKYIEQAPFLKTFHVSEALSERERAYV